MDIDTASNFLVGSILFGLGLTVLTIAIVVINNIFSKYWKPVKWMSISMLYPENTNTGVTLTQEANVSTVTTTTGNTATK
jgi:hypothetical protein